jgi:hypothetical protein
MGACTMFIITVVSEVVNDRALVAMVEDLWALPFLVTIYLLPAHTNPWIYYGVITALLSYPYVAGLT